MLVLRTCGAIVASNKLLKAGRNIIILKNRKIFFSGVNQLFVGSCRKHIGSLRNV